MFLMNLLSPSSGQKSKEHFFYPEDGSSRFLQNDGLPTRSHSAASQNIAILSAHMLVITEM
jgi:hypothetical protein